MLYLYEACERLALESTRVGDAKTHIANTLATIYEDEIRTLPWKLSERERVSQFGAREYRLLVLLVIDELQRWGRTILLEYGLGDDDTAHDMRMTFAPGHALIIKRKWDACAESPVWQMFTRKLGEVS